MIFSLREHSFFLSAKISFLTSLFSSLCSWRNRKKNRSAKGEEVVSLFVFPTEEEIKTIKKKIESGFHLEDWEDWVYREFM